MTFSDTAYRAPKAIRMYLEQIEKHPPIRESDLRAWHDLIESTGVIAGVEQE